MVERVLFTVMVIEHDIESCGGRAMQSSHANPRHPRQKLEVYNEVLRRSIEFRNPIARYTLDVNVEKAEDVLAHKRFLRLAEDHANGLVFKFT